MHRSGRKRKHVETLIDYEEFSEIKSEIKTEPTEVQFLDDAPLSNPCCCLCKTSSGNQLAVFGNGPTPDPDIANKIHSCSGLEISSETNSDIYICRGCLQQLDGHNTFQNAALKCNEYAQNKMTEARAEFDSSPEEISFCRFCSQMCKQLLDMYPGGESPEHDLLQKIRECLAIEVNAWDPVTKICGNCIKSFDDLFEFRTRHLPTSVFIKDEIWHDDQSELTKRIKQEDDDTSVHNLDHDLSVSDSDCSSEENKQTDPAFAGRQKLATMRPELVQLIGAEVDGKNFTALSADDKQLKIIFEDQLFRFLAERENGSSLWICGHRNLRGCRVKLEIEATGKCATLLAGVGSHTHPPGKPKLMECPLGRGMTEMNGKAEAFYIFCSNRSKINFSRSVILQGFRYFLQKINARSVKSAWYCVKRYTGGCKAKLACYGIFHKADVYGEHNHGKLTQFDIETVMLQHDIATMSKDAISEFQNVNTIQMIKSAIRIKKRAPAIDKKSLVKEKDPQIFRLLKQADAERNFEVIKTGTQFKVVHDGYEYLYFKLSDKCTIWKCIMYSLRRCKLLAKLTPDGKQFERCAGKHSHGTEVAEIFRCPLGKRMIGKEPLWLLNRSSRYTWSRYVVYRENLFNMDNINQKGEVRWSCYKKNCGAVLSTKGNFQEVVLRYQHLHEKPPESLITNLLSGSTTSEAGCCELESRPT